MKRSAGPIGRSHRPPMILSIDSGPVTQWTPLPRAIVTKASYRCLTSRYAGEMIAVGDAFFAREPRPASPVTATQDSEWAMIESIEFTNFKALRKTTLPLEPFTLLLGPNGSGKSTVLQALRDIAAIATKLAGHPERAGAHAGTNWSSLLSVTAEDRKAAVEIKLRLRLENRVVIATFQWHQGKEVTKQLVYQDGTALQPVDANLPLQWLSRMQVYTLDSSAIAQPVHVNPGVSLQQNGTGLAAVLDDLKDNHPERWELLLTEMRRWLPEYDNILFDKPHQGQKGIVLRTKKGGYRIPAKELSQGTLVALALLTLAYLRHPPSVVGLEEIDRGLHPRLLRHLQDALYRLSYPDRGEETRPPIQVIATTHSPYLLDLYREHPEEVVLAQKEGLEVEMKRLTEIEHYEDILGDSPLSEVWYSGVLGGVSVKP
jgi:predicted ATPase